MDSVVLIGPRGSGKTAVGKRLSRLLQLPFIDADEEFTRHHGYITDFVSQHGWEEFRRLETELIADIYAQHRYDKVVFATGGEAVSHNQSEQYRTRNVESLSGLGLIFYLLPYPDLGRSAAVLADRVQRSHASAYSRPSLTGNSNLAAEMLSTLEQSYHLYEAAANHVIYGGGRSHNDIAMDIFIIYKRDKH